MSGSVNKVILVGNLGADPDVRTTGQGQMVATLSIATSERFKDRDGNAQERTEWHRVVLWGKTAELAQRYLQKGRKVYVEGRIQTRSWDDPTTGTKRYSTEVVASEMTFLDSGDSSGQSRDSGPRRDSPSQGRPAQGQGSQGQRRQAEPPPADEPGYFDSSVPF